MVHYISFDRMQNRLNNVPDKSAQLEDIGYNEMLAQREIIILYVCR